MDKKEGVKEGRPQNKHLKPFAKGQTAPAELKSAGRERKKEAKKIMDMVMQFGGMTVDELKAIADKKKGSLTVMEARLMKYVSNDKYLIDWLDRHISKAPTQVTGDEGPIEIDIQSASIDDLLKLIKLK